MFKTCKIFTHDEIYSFYEFYKNLLNSWVVLKMWNKINYICT